MCAREKGGGRGGGREPRGIERGLRVLVFVFRCACVRMGTCDVRVRAYGYVWVRLACVRVYMCVCIRGFKSKSGESGKERRLGQHENTTDKT